jgi:dTDP-4-dehydrorhamnose 3,5-epimerase
MARQSSQSAFGESRPGKSCRRGLQNRPLRIKNVNAMAARLDTADDLPLPAGVALCSLKSHRDQRGDLTELFRNQWHHTPLPVQWNLLRSKPNALRGMHVHLKHWDYTCVIAGALAVGLHDLRTTERRSTLMPLRADQLQVLVIPPGVAHGFYSHEATAMLVGSSNYYEPSDHRRCRWDCPELALDWPCTAPELSEQDARASGYAALKAELQAAAALL